MRRNLAAAAMIALSAFATAAQAELTSPKVGWQAEFDELFHDVGGTVTIVDDDTVRFDDFTYDGTAPQVYFYLGASNTQDSFASGIPIGLQLVEAFDGSQTPFEFNLPAGQTLEGWHAISVWCVQFSVNFGSGSFAAPPPIAGDFNGDGRVDAADYTTWRDGLGSTYVPMDYDVWKDNFGAPSAGGGAGGGASGTPLAAASVPEPTVATLLIVAMAMLGWTGLAFRGRRRRQAASGRSRLSAATGL